MDRQAHSISHALLLQIEEARRREQADKMAAIHALERQSQEIMRHKSAMAALQTRIASMQSQLLVGGQKVEDTPQFRCAAGWLRSCWDGQRRN
jgi:kinesin family protein 3/17